MHKNIISQNDSQKKIHTHPKNQHIIFRVTNFGRIRPIQTHICRRIVGQLMCLRFDTGNNIDNDVYCRGFVVNPSGM